MDIAGERVGVRGPRNSLRAPHPGPLSTVMSSPKVASPVGRGAEGALLSTFLKHTLRAVCAFAVQFRPTRRVSEGERLATIAESLNPH